MVRRMLLTLGIAAAVLAGAVSLAGSAVVVAPPGYQVIDLGSFGGRDTYGSSANAINDRGQVVGYSGTSNGLSLHAFRWEKGKMTDLGTLGGSYSSANAINERGDVVG